MLRRLIVLTLTSAFVLQACGPTTDGSFTGDPNPLSPNTPIMDMDPFQLILNDERQRQSLSSLGQNNKLATAAQRHADDMSIQNYFSHTSADGRSFTDRLDEVNYSYCWASENIAYGYTSNAAVFTAWMNSPGHRDNMMHTSAQEFGLGYAADGHYWVMMLGRPC